MTVTKISPGQVKDWSVSLHAENDVTCSTCHGEKHESADDRKLVEAWTAEPTLIIGGPIALVWGEYDFWIDGEFSHCGIDSVSLVKIDDTWKIANWMWTVETEKCATKPK